MQQYSISDFENLDYTYNLPNDIISVINDLSELVSAPEYNRTPQFMNDKYKKKKYDLLPPNDLKKTIIKKNENGINKDIDELRKYINKLTENTSIIMCNNIINKINEIKDLYSYKDLEHISQIMFNIIISNNLFSDIYALLYSKLINHNFIKAIIDINFNKFMDLYKSPRESTENISFDDICKHNDLLDKNKSAALLYTHLVKYDIIPKKAIIDLINECQDFILKLLNIENKKQLVDELSEVIFILVKNSYHLIDDINILEQITNNIQYIANMKNTNRKSITNKTIFKHMDLIDALGKK